MLFFRFFTNFFFKVYIILQTLQLDVKVLNNINFRCPSFLFTPRLVFILIWYHFIWFALNLDTCKYQYTCITLPIAFLFVNATSCYILFILLKTRFDEIPTVHFTFERKYVLKYRFSIQSFYWLPVRSLRGLHQCWKHNDEFNNTMQGFWVTWYH